MSAFFVQEGTIDAVIESLCCGIHMSGDEAANALGRKLLEMNAEALRQRYSLDNTQELQDYLSAAAEYVYVEPKCSDGQHVKSLECYTYQCAEGNVPNTELYKRVSAWEAKLLTLLVPGNLPDDVKPDRDIPGYKDAQRDRVRP